MQMLANMQLNQNQFQSQENWPEEDTGHLIANQYKMSNNKLKMGAATSTNFMNNQQLKMSMLRSVQQNMPNLPSVSNSPPFK